MLSRSITFRLALLFAFATMLLLAGIGYFLNRSVESHLADMDWGEIHGKWPMVHVRAWGTAHLSLWPVGRERKNPATSSACQSLRHVSIANPCHHLIGHFLT